ncbi:hypothetical protein B0H10DRAFT_1962666 [Mycena sp. CBHHK59/15]|nr:hypothetical protein B0H10DRAFT_1962666 [Mycena sp. CBHHK59/15]
MSRLYSLIPRKQMRRRPSYAHHSPPCPGDPAPDTTGKKINRSHRQRAAKRACEDPEVHMTARLSAAANHPDAANRIPRVVRVETNAVNLNYTKPGFVGNSQAASSGQVGELKYWIGQGYFFLKCDGLDSIVIVDEQDHIVTALPGHPPGADWDESIHKMCDCFRKVREETDNCFTYEDLHHRRGNFASINYGNSFSAGQRCPGTLKQSHKAKEEAVKMLSSEPWALRFSAFQSHVFGQNFPQEFAHYKV